MSAEDLLETARLNEARLIALVKLNEMAGASVHEITHFALEQAVALTQSRIGYLAFLNEGQDVLTMHAWSKTAMADCAISDKPRVYPLEATGLWGEAVRQRQPIVTNDYGSDSRWKRGLPIGHVRLQRHMNVPVFDGERIALVAGVGNKEREYDESDVRQLTLLMQGMWSLIQRHREQAKLRQSRDELERRVRERTARLVAANEELRQKHEELEAIYEGMLDGLLIAEAATTRFVRANPAAAALLGYSQDELLGMSTADIHPPEVLAAVQQRFEALRTGRPQATENVPLRRRDGAVVYADIRSHPTVYRGMPCVVGIFHDTTEKKRAHEQVQQERERLRCLLELYDRESRLVGFEIHDGLAQYLAGAIMHLCTFRDRFGPRADTDWSSFEVGLHLVRQSHRESRRLITDLRSDVLDEMGVVAAVQDLVEQLRNREQSPRIEFLYDEEIPRLPPPLENCVFRVVQEGLTNACRHSGSEAVRVALRQNAGQLSIEIEDWGVGFESTDRQQGRFGLLGIRERGRVFGGRVAIESRPGSGTRIRVNLPIGPDAGKSHAGDVRA